MQMPPACGCIQAAAEQGCEKNQRENGQQARDRRCILVKAAALVSAHNTAQGHGKIGQTGREVPVSCEQGGGGRRSAVAALLCKAHKSWAEDGNMHLTGDAHGHL